MITHEMRPHRRGLSLEVITRGHDGGRHLDVGCDLLVLGIERSVERRR